MNRRVESVLLLFSLPIFVFILSVYVAGDLLRWFVTPHKHQDLW